MTQEKKNIFHTYEPIPGVYDEIFTATGNVRPELEMLINLLNKSAKDIYLLHKTAKEKLRQRGVTFTVYSDDRGLEKIFPFDPIPRVITHTEWQRIEKGLQQRVVALNEFLIDIYSKQRIIKDKIIPAEIVLTSTGYIPELRNIHPINNNYIYIAGIDLIRNHAGDFMVLEDNLRVPSGISYVMENRLLMKELFSDILYNLKVKSVDDYPLQLRRALQLSCDNQNGFMVVLTPGPFNAAYFEHSFLARKMGCPLVLNTDLIVKNDIVYLKTYEGLKRVDIIYRRIDDKFIDPTFFDKDSLLGVPGLVKAYSSNNVIIANALGNGVADDKAIYPFVPDFIRYYLNEEPIIPQVSTYDCTKKCDYKYVLSHLDELVVKIVDQSGGYGILIGPHASKSELDEMRNKLLKNPRDYIAQPLEQLSTCPTLGNNSIRPHRVDLRPFVIAGDLNWVMPGGLTRVAKTDSYIVNSSQGGGSKDTWILE